MRKLKHYLTAIPKVVPEGKIVVHNHIRPAVRLGVRGFRAWLADKGDPVYERCDCDWAPRLSEHDRVVRPTPVTGV